MAGAVSANSTIPSVQIGRERDKKIIELISEHGPFTRDQVQQLVFPAHKWPQKCSQRLNKLAKAGKIKRLRFEDVGQFVYYAGKWTHKSEHQLMVNDVYVSLITQKKSWFKLQALQREYRCQWDSGELWADALVVLINTAKDTLKPVFAEVDRATNPFNKVEIYTQYYLSRAWCGSWWAKKDTEGAYTFPRVLVVTDRPERVRRAIEKDNAEGLRFTVATVEQIKKDIYAYL